MRFASGRRMHKFTSLLNNTQGAAILEFAISVPILVVFVVGIYDFSGAFNQKQKIAQAAQEGAIVAAAQPMSDIATGTGNPDSLQPVVTAIFNSLAGSGVLPNANSGTCKTPASPPGWVPSGPPVVLTWTYKIIGCSNLPASSTKGCNADTTDTLFIVINRGWVPSTASSPIVVGTSVTVSYDYDWSFNSAIQLLFPGATYSARTCLSEIANVHNQT
jgi:hypothetical protein